MPYGIHPEVWDALIGSGVTDPKISDLAIAASLNTSYPEVLPASYDIIFAPQNTPQSVSNINATAFFTKEDISKRFFGGDPVETASAIWFGDRFDFGMEASEVDVFKGVLANYIVESPAFLRKKLDAICRFDYLLAAWICASCADLAFRLIGSDDEVSRDLIRMVRSFCLQEEGFEQIPEMISKLIDDSLDVEPTDPSYQKSAAIEAAEDASVIITALEEFKPRAAMQSIENALASVMYSVRERPNLSEEDVHDFALQEVNDIIVRAIYTFPDDPHPYNDPSLIK